MKKIMINLLIIIICIGMAYIGRESGFNIFIWAFNTGLWGQNFIDAVNEYVLNKRLDRLEEENNG